MARKQRFIVKSMLLSFLILGVLSFIFKEYIFLKNVGFIEGFVSSDSIFFIGEYIYLDYTLSNNRALLICSVLIFLLSASLLFFNKGSVGKK